MKKRDVYRIQYIGKGWCLGGPNVPQIDRWHAVKTTAVHAGAGLAKRRWLTHGWLGQLVVHGRDGRIQYERTYGRDPERFPG